ncbi:cellulase-like protein [Pseudoroseomonas deserti]|uniref:Cellulase-like protein n=1 Tax=Teichococcus deserti TaxID=1817963 RepID=A0A1V2GWC6_9PROT|nr:cellulase-like protein [Pseudoroseomonas deserti]
MPALLAAPLLATLAAVPAAAQQEPGWVAKRTAQLQALDKVTARITIVDAPVNQPVRFGTLSVTVRACNARPPEEVPDAAAWLEVLDTRNDPNGTPAFRGWMFANAPGVSMLEHPVYDLRVLECK